MSIAIKGTGSALPEKKVSNADLAKIVDTNDEWIKERTGIENRHIATGDTVASLAALAAKRALEDAGAKAEDVQAIIVASCSSEMALPCVACQVQSAIGANKAVAFDLNAACSGFLFAMNTIEAYFSAGVYTNALVIGAEVLSNIIDWEDRGTCILFGDGAGAAYLEKDETKSFKFLQFSDGTKGEVLSCEQRRQGSAFNECKKEFSPYVTMDGREVFKFATRKVPEAIMCLLDEARMQPNDVDCYILHQANLRIIEYISKRMGVDMNKYPHNVEQVGNTSSASIPILLDEVRKAGKLKSGMKIVMSGFGAGLTYGAGLLEV